MAQFRTKARAVDLLGKGQIADLPTAITELWKNGYDAYADSLKAEVYLEASNSSCKSYFIISDDGKGMSRKDILEKWLVLGTDSKSRAKIEQGESDETLWKRPRIKAGEKGIGRLSVAYLGSPMLMLTKKIGHPIQAMFFDWRLLENFNLFLDDIIIPIAELTTSTDFENVFASLKNEFLKNFDLEKNTDGATIWEDSQVVLKETIISSVNGATVDSAIAENLLQNIINIDDHHGTKFLIFEPIQQITQLAEKDDDNLEDIRFVISSLSCFTNSFELSELNNQNQSISTDFIIHKEVGVDYDLLTSQGNFFSADDFDLSDVLIDGEFDGYGSFNGTIRIYDETISYSYTNPRKKDKRNFYGRIPIKLGYSQGEEKSSILDEFSFTKLKDKIEAYGGLYIFRDGFRVLPYGRTNADFLGFEERRSRRAGTFYFSYRRMYGYLDISRERNPYLKDKSSREGLINNSQYRAFINDAANFFEELAKEYFATNPKKSLFIDKKKELNSRYESIKADKDREKSEKISFTKSLSQYQKKFKAYQSEYISLLSQLEDRLNHIKITYSEIESILDRIHQLDAEYNRLLPELPKRYQPTDIQLDRLDKYAVELENFNAIVSPQKLCLIRKAQEILEIQDLKKDFSKRIAKYRAELEKKIYNHKDCLISSLKYLKSEFENRSENLLNDFDQFTGDLNVQIDSKEKISHYSAILESKYENLIERAEQTIFPIVRHIKTLNFDVDEELVQGVYRMEYENMKAQWEQVRETAQLGIAVEIIDHEFNQLYAKINHSLRLLTSDNIFANSCEFKYLIKNFKQLETKYELLSPLYRISGAIPKLISGEMIYAYLRKFFENSLKDINIELFATEAFLQHSINIKEPVIHTVFINIVNNAIYWLKNSSSKVIKLDYNNNTNEFLISNSGQRIEEHRLEKIFQLFYSNRPNGRGIGLYLVKQVLMESGYDIYATNDKQYNSLGGACFVIKLKS